MRSTALALVVLGAASFGASQVAAQARAGATPPFEAGKHYTVLSPAQPTSTDSGKVEVAEVFMFGCPACFSFETRVQDWRARRAADYVNFVRVPAQWPNHPESPIHARAYYTAEALGKSAEIDVAFFNEFHVNRNRLDTEAKIAALFAQYGVDDATFKNTFNSFAVNAKVKRADELVTRYQVQGTPTVVVNGKYVVTGGLAGTYEAFFAIIDELAARENAAAASGGAVR